MGNQPVMKIALFIIGLGAIGYACISRQSTEPELALETETIFRVENPATANRDFCVYKVLKVEKGNCPEFRPGTVICVFCPGDRICPGETNKSPSGRFELVDRNGNIQCEGTWVKRFDLANPDACIDCPKGVKDRYAFFGDPTIR